MKNSISWNQYYEAFTKSPSETQSLIESGQIAKCIDITLPELIDSEKSLLIIEVANYLVGLLDSERLTSSFPEIDSVKIEMIIECLHEPTHTKNNPENLDSNQAAPEVAPSHHTPAIRTMADDMEHVQHPEREATYTSTQEVLLRESRKATPTGDSTASGPAATTPETPAAPPVQPAETKAPEDTRWNS